MAAAPAPPCEIEIGAITVTYVPDGHIYMEAVGAFPGSTPEMWAAHPEYTDGHGNAVMSLGSLLVRSGEQLCLIDLSWGPTSMTFGNADPGPYSPRLAGGELVNNLGKIGVAPGDIDAVYFSHLHSDHTGWIVDPSTTEDDAPEARLMFPNATHYVSDPEWAYWNNLPAGTRGPVPTPTQLEVLATRREPITEGDRPVVGIDIMPTPGHTPGHLSFVISSGGERALVLGDAVHCPLEILEPELSFSADVDREMARRTRRAIAAELEVPGTYAAGTHFSDLVFGRLLTGDAGSSWHFPDSQVRTAD